MQSGGHDKVVVSRLLETVSHCGLHGGSGMGNVDSILEGHLSELSVAIQRQLLLDMLQQCQFNQQCQPVCRAAATHNAGRKALDSGIDM